MIQAYVHPSPCSNRQTMSLSPLSTRFFPCFPPSCFLHVHIARRTVHSPHPLWHTCIQYAQSPGKLWSCWMHSGIRFLESSKLNDPECDVVLPLKWYRMQCQNWSKSFRARNMQSTLEGVLGPKLGPDFGDVLKVVLNFMSATWEKLLDNIVQVSTNWEEKSFTAFQKPNQHSWLLKSHFCCLLGWLLGFNLHSWIEQGTANNPNLANVN